jgi:hypothetical protein
MLAFNLKKDSWHMWVANFGNTRIGEYTQKHGTDICTYIRAFFWGALGVIVCAVGIVLGATWIGFALYGLGAYALGFINEIPGESFILFGICFVALLIITLVFLTEKYHDYKREKRRRQYASGLPPPEPGFVTLAYRKFKDKTCFKINFTKED